MIWIVVVLYALAAVLPFIGLARVLTQAEGHRRRVRADIQRKPTEIEAESEPVAEQETFDDFLVGWRQRVSEGAVSSARGDLALIGSGLACGAIASIWSLFL